MIHSYKILVQALVGAGGVHKLVTVEAKNREEALEIVEKEHERWKPKCALMVVEVDGNEDESYTRLVKAKRRELKLNELKKSILYKTAYLRKTADIIDKKLDEEKEHLVVYEEFAKKLDTLLNKYNELVRRG